MTTTDTLEVGWVPDWVARYINYRTSGVTTQQRRRQLALNVSSLIGLLFGFVIAGAYMLYNPALWPWGILIVASSLCSLAQPLVYRFGEVALFVYVTGWMNALIMLQIYLMGRGVGLELYLLVIPVLGPITIPNRIGILVLATLVFAGCMFASMLIFQEPALAAANDPLLRTVMLGTAVFFTALLFMTVVRLTALDAERWEAALEVEHQRSEALLYNLLPKEIAARLKVEPDRTIADKLPKVAILFADIVNFTPRAASLPPEEVVDFLNRIFSRFDELAEKHRLEKIKTIGDAYMVAAGMPSPVGDPVHRMADMALDMLRVTKEMSPQFPDGLEVRIGLHAGTAVAGVIGNNKLFYDVWGETVNTASRMESHGEPGRIQVTGPAYEELKADYSFEERGTVEVKGMGPVETWWLTEKVASV